MSVSSTSAAQDDPAVRGEPHADGERRAHPRYSPDPWLPVVFASRRDELQCAGHIVDISEGGLRLVAPPSCSVPLVWGEQFDLTLAYSESLRRFGLEGLTLEAVVVRILSDKREYSVHAMFRDPAVHDRLHAYLLALEEGDHAARSQQETVPLPERR